MGLMYIICRPLALKKDDEFQKYIFVAKCSQKKLILLFQLMRCDFKHNYENFTVFIHIICFLQLLLLLVVAAITTKYYHKQKGIFEDMHFGYAKRVS